MARLGRPLTAYIESISSRRLVVGLLETAGILDVVQQMSEAGYVHLLADLNISGIVAQSGEVETMRKPKQLGIPLERKNSNTIHKALQRSTPDMAVFLVNAGVRLDLYSSSSRMPLELAAEHQELPLD